MSGPDVARELALQKMRDAAGELHDLDAARHFAERVGVGLAVLLADRAGDIVGVLLEKLLELEHEARALRGRRAAPGGRRFLRGSDGVADLRCARQPELGRLLARRRIEDRREAPRDFEGATLSVDGVPDTLHCFPAHC